MPPAAGDGFEWVAAPWGAMLRARALARVAHGWTSRQLELRGTPDQQRAGWSAVAAAAGLSAERLVRLKQVHGNAVHVASATAPALQPPEADVTIVHDPRLVVAVQVADCAPVLIADRNGTLAAAAHAGWRGTAADVSGTTVRAMAARAEFDPAAADAAIGPCIGPCCYAVGEELVDAFRARGWDALDCDRWFTRRDGGLYLDIWTANADQLIRAGLPAARVHVSRLCTACHPEWFYSYRREGAGTGRLAGFIRPAG